MGLNKTQHQFKPGDVNPDITGIKGTHQQQQPVPYKCPWVLSALAKHSKPGGWRTQTLWEKCLCTVALQAQVTLCQELSCSDINNRPVRLRPKTTPCAELRDTGVQREPSGRAQNACLPFHSGLCRQQHNKLFCNSHCSNLIIPLNSGLFFCFPQIGLYCTMPWCSATCMKQRYARRKQHFAMIIYLFYLFLNWILDFFSQKCVSLCMVQCTFKSVSPTALQNSVLTTVGKISARHLNTREKMKKLITLLWASLLLPYLAKHSFWEKSML